jgi:hypothetical protein
MRSKGSPLAPGTYLLGVTRGIFPVLDVLVDSMEFPKFLEREIGVPGAPVVT